MKKLWAFVILCCVLTAGARAQTPVLTAAEIDALIKEALAHGKGDKLLSEYTYTMRWHERRTEKKGQVKETTEVYESYIPTLKRSGDTSAVLLKLTENGQPLPPEKVEKERQKAAERLLKAEAESQKQNSRVPPAFGEPPSKGAYFMVRVGNVQLSVRALLQGCAFSDPRRASVDGRAAWALDFRALPDFVFPNELRYVRQLSGTLWIDAAERVLLRAEGWPREMTAHAGKPALLYEQMPLPDGYWMPRQVQLNGDTHRAFFEQAGNKLGVDYSFDFADFKRFGAETKDLKLKEPERKP